MTRVRKTKKALFLKDSLLQIRIDDQYFSSILTKIRNFFDISFELKSNDTKEQHFDPSTVIFKYW